MRSAPSFLFVALALALGACSALGPKSRSARTPVAVTLPPSKTDIWMGLASAPDVERLLRLPMAWSEGLREARASAAAAVRAEGDLLQPGVALARPAPTPGSYNCRLVRLGRTTPRAPAFERFKPFFCYVEVEGDLLTIVKQTGSERPAGRLWEDDVPTRLVFLGSMALGNREVPKAYGEDRARDMAGVMERIAPMRWRLVIPYPRAGSKLDVFELTPVAEQPRS